VDLVGIEPTTSSMPWKRAPSCATGPLSMKGQPFYFLLNKELSQTHNLRMAFVYILQSEKNGRFYVGSTSSLQLRLADHQRGQTPSTRGRGPWHLVYQEQFASQSDARRREREIKSWKSHRSIEELISQKPAG
jgi:putative endonuclease